MKSPLFSYIALAVSLALAFFAGRGSLGPQLNAQGINPLNGAGRSNVESNVPTPGSSRPVPGGAGTATGSATGSAAGAPEVLMYGETNGVASVAQNGILAVTGSYGVGTSVLYVIDTETKQLAVYEARGGSRSMRRITLVGARRIDLDLSLRSYNDESDYQYDQLEKMFADRAQPSGRPDPVRNIDMSAERR